MPEYALGSVIKMSAKFQASAVDVDPAQVQAHVKTPLGTTLSYTYGSDAELVKDSVGDYTLSYTPTVEGRHSFRFVGVGTYAGAEESYFDIRESQFN